MSRSVLDAEIEVYKPDNTSDTPDFVVPSRDIHQISIKKRLKALKDKGSIKLDNTAGKYANGLGYGESYGLHYGAPNPITTGDKIVVRTRLEGEESLTDRWTAIAHPPSYQSGPGNRTIEFKASDFVFQVLSWRVYFNAFEDRQISGSEDAILETVLDDKAPEIGQSQIEDVGETTDFFADGTGLFTIVEELAAQGDAILANDGEDLVFKRISDIPVEFDLARGAAGDISDYEVAGSDDELANWVRVDGGTGTAIGDEQTTQDSYQTVSESSRFTHQLSTRKSEIDRLELWTRTTGSGEDVTVRLQKDDGGAPVAPGDRQSDIARRTLASQFIDDEGFTTFIFPEHTLPEPSPWIIIETDGSSGQDIGIDSSTGEPAFKAYFPFPLNVRTSDRESMDEYRRREVRLKNDQLGTRTATQAQAQSTLEHRSEPRQTLSADALSVRAHNLNPGEAVGVDFPKDRARGTFLVTEANDTYQGESNRLATSLELQEAGSL